VPDPRHAHGRRPTHGGDAIPTEADSGSGKA
jgi:hypothetical protein